MLIQFRSDYAIVPDAWLNCGEEEFSSTTVASWSKR